MPNGTPPPRPSDSRSEVRKEGAGALGRGVASVALRVTGAGLGFALTIVLARALGPVGLGVYAYGLAIATLGSVLAQLGLPVLVVRETARYFAANNWASLRGLLSGAVLIVFLVAAVCVGGAMLLTVVSGRAIGTVDVATLIPALMLVPMIALNNVGGASLRGLGYAIKGQLPEQLFRPGLFLALLLAVLLLATSTELSPSLAMALHATAGFLAFLIGLLLLIRALPEGLRSGRADFSDWPRLRRSLLPLSILVGLQVINGQADILMLGYFRDAGEVGVYRVAHQGASVVNLTLFAIGLTVEPSIARLHQAGELRKLQHVVSVTARMAFALSAMITLVLVAFGQPLLSFVFGNAFAEAYLPLGILCLGQVALAYAGWSVLLLNMSGNERITAKVTAIGAAANVAANAILIPRFGLHGAAVATAATLFLWKFSLSIVAERQTGVRTMIFPPRPSRAEA